MAEAAVPQAYQPEQKITKRQQRQIWENYILAGIDAGCPQDQMVGLLQHGLFFQPKQLQMSAAARACDHRCVSCTELYAQGKPIARDCPNCGPRMIGVGGARGGGKSRWMIGQAAVDDCQRFPGLSVLYVRKSAKTLRAQIRKLMRATLPMDGAYNYKEQAGEIVFPNGSMITIRHFKDESEIDNFLGEEYDLICYEELTTLSADKFNNLNTCLRTSKRGWRPRVYASWNWGGIGHAWVMDMFYLPWEREQAGEGKQIATRYILAKATDNAYNNPEYINDLQNLVGWKYQSWYLGDPHFSAGNFFANFREQVHVYPNETIHPDERLFVRWFGSMDYGSSMPNCFHLHGEDENGDCYTVDEYWSMGDTISENAEGFRDMLRMHHLSPDELEFIATGYDVLREDRETRKDGSTVQTEYQENNISITPCHINRVNAFSQMQERLGNPDRGIKPTWFISRRCPNLIEQVKTAQCDLKRPNDIVKQNADRETGEGGSDALEAARNGLVMAYNSSLTDARPIQMGAYKSLSAPSSQEPPEMDAQDQARWIPVEIVNGNDWHSGF